MSSRPHIVLIVPRGEAIRNFLYSDTLPTLHARARVTLLSVVTDDWFRERFAPLSDEIVPLQAYRENGAVGRLRYLVHTAHYRWLWSAPARNLWEWRDAEARPVLPWIRRRGWNALVRLLANRPTLEALTAVERRLAWSLRPTRDFDVLFERLAPDLVFNCSHVHGEAAELPIRVAHRLGIATAGFIFSWDNLSSRSRIFPPYGHYVVWNEAMRRQLLGLYPRVAPERVLATGTPQMDYHFKSEFLLSREELCRRIGADPARPFVLYTTGMCEHFPEEHRTIDLVARLLAAMTDLRPQLVVRTYIKGTSPETQALARNPPPGVIFPTVQWRAEHFTPLYEDLATYSSLLHHAAMGVNAASTVSLELLMLDKPVVNLGFDPPGSTLPHHFRWSRHLDFDHYRPVVESGAVMAALRPEDVEGFLRQGLLQPEIGREARRAFIRGMFGDTLDGRSGERVAHALLQLAGGT